MSDLRETVDAPGAPAAVGPYSHAVKAAGLLFCSGQIPLDPSTGELVSGSIGEETRQCLENLTAVVTAGGGSLADAVRCTIYLTDMGDFAEVNDVYGEYVGETLPARAAVRVAALPMGPRAEIDAIVALPPSRSRRATSRRPPPRSTLRPGAGRCCRRARS